MTAVVLIRHAPTSWNVEGRIQGQTDVALNAAGRAEAGRWRLPACFREYAWTASPLARARETAQLLGLKLIGVEPRLAEMHWGEWEGRTWAELHAARDPRLQGYRAQGLDFQPPRGESRRAVLERLQAWLQEVSAQAHPVGAVTHRGVIHAALALATGWDMRSEPPHYLDWASAHIFRVAADAGLAVERLNVALTEAAP